MIDEANVAIVIVNYRTPALTLRCLAALATERTSLPCLRVIIVDGGSGDGSADSIAAGLKDPAYSGWATLMALPINGGFGWANNQAMLTLLQSDTSPDYIHLINPDTEIEAGAVGALLSVLRDNPRVGAVGSQLIEPSGHKSASAFRFPSPAREFLAASRTPKLGPLIGIAATVIDCAQAGPVEWVTGASVMLRAAMLRDVGLFDHGFFLYFEEVELMHRMHRAGWAVWHAPKSRVMHIGGAATGVVSGAEAKRALPPYWFASRNRFFALTLGNDGPSRATRRWLLGDWIWRLRYAIGLGRKEGETPGERAALKASLDEARSTIFTPAVTQWNDAVGAPPAWMDSL